jgi:pimeloyl-ACP methyl ester carboxylesterase
VDVVLLHAGLTDPGEWDGIRPRLEEQGHRVVAPELWREGPLVDIVLDAIPSERTALVGTSMGGRGALEAASAAPDRVSALVMIGSNPFGWSDAVRDVAQNEEALYDAGRFDEAAALMVRAWLVGARREEQDVPAELRDRVFAMQRRAYDLAAFPDVGPFELENVRAPILFIRGELDWPEVEQASRRFTRARQEVIVGAAHLPTMEQPEEVARIILDFLDGLEPRRT